MKINFFRSDYQKGQQPNDNKILFIQNVVTHAKTKKGDRNAMEPANNLGYNNTVRGGCKYRNPIEILL